MPIDFITSSMGYARVEIIGELVSKVATFYELLLMEERGYKDGELQQV